MDPGNQLYLAAAAFLATHFVTSTPLRGTLVRMIGEKPYLLIYSLAAFATLTWTIWAYVRAPVEPLWSGPRWLPAAVMPFAFILITCGYFSRNPTFVGADRLLKHPDPARGIIRVTRHPIMWGFMLWAAAHILARGELRAAVFFGTMLLLAGIGTLLLDARKAKSVPEDWARFTAITSHLPFAAIAADRNRLDLAEIGWRNPALGLALYALFFWSHAWLFGARPY